MDRPHPDSSNPPKEEPIQVPDPLTVTIALPEEFVTLCQRDNVTPEIVSYAVNPRKDGYCSNGSDERDLAQAYYYRLGFLRWFGWDQ